MLLEPMSTDKVQKVLATFKGRGFDVSSDMACQFFETLVELIILTCPNDSSREACLARLTDARCHFLSSYGRAFVKEEKHAISDAKD